MKDRFRNTWREIEEDGRRYPAYLPDRAEREIVRHDHPLAEGETLQDFLRDEGRLPDDT